jgi:citrate synthase
VIIKERHNRAMEKTATLIVDGKSYDLPVVVGTDGNRAIDISRLRKETGLITYDPGFGNTGSCLSSISYMDGEKGILRYRGIPIEQLAEHSSFIETAFLLIAGELPTKEELSDFSAMLNDHSLVHEDMHHFFERYPRGAHPMGILSSMVNALRAFYPEIPERSEEAEINKTFARLLSKLRTIFLI